MVVWKRIQKINIKCKITTNPVAEVVMLDPDASTRTGDGSGPGTSGPWLHALWTGCTGGSTYVGEMAVPYNTPAPPPGAGDHR